MAVNHQTGEIVYGPDLDSHGVMQDPEAVLAKAADAVRNAVEGRGGDGFDLPAIQQAVRQAAAQVIRSETARKPVILPVVIDL